jgi:hypothetical protein
LFLITLPRMAKSQEVFKLSSLCHISIIVEAYRAQTGLVQCHNCQQFGHIWANCRQPPRCLWCGGGHLYKGCPEKGNAASTPACCNCQLAEREKAHPANYWGCSHAKEGAEGTQTYNRKGVLFHPHLSRCLLCGGAPWQERGPAATSGKSGGGGSSWHSGAEGLHALSSATSRSVSLGSKCKQ